MVARWDRLATLPQRWDCSVDAVATRSAGPISHPTRHPVMANVLATPLRTMVWSAASGTRVGSEANSLSS